MGHASGVPKWPRVILGLVLAWAHRTGGGRVKSLSSGILRRRGTLRFSGASRASRLPSVAIRESSWGDCLIVGRLPTRDLSVNTDHSFGTIPIGKASATVTPGDPGSSGPDPRVSVHLSHSSHTIPHVRFSNLRTPPSLPKCCPSHDTSAAQAYPLERPRGAPQVLTYYSPEWDQIGLLCERLSVSFCFLQKSSNKGLFNEGVYPAPLFLMRPQLRNTPRITKPSPLMIQPVLVSYRLRITLKKALETSFSLNCRLWRPRSLKEVSNFLGARPPTSDFTSETSLPLHCLVDVLCYVRNSRPDRRSRECQGGV